MAVSFIPLLLPLLIAGVLIYGAKGGWRRFLKTLTGSALVVGLVLAPFFVPGLILKSKAEEGDAKAQYRFARWLENTPESIGSIILWPFAPEVLEGYAWLEKSANGGFLAAIYVQGVRLKHGIHVPKPTGWTGPSGNVFPQPEIGRALIEKALSHGFKPSSADSEASYYWQVYRGYDPNG
jgi:hypothetical protein